MRERISNLINYMTKIFFIPISLVGFLFFCSDLYADNIMDKIIKLEKENWELDKKIIERKVFKLDDKQNFFGAGAEKMFLVDDQGEQWVFSLYPSGLYIKNSELVYRLAFLCGMQLPMIREIGLPINGKLRRGSLRKVLPNVIILQNCNLSGLSSLEVEYLLKSQILEWLVWNYDTDDDEFRVNKESGEVFCIDHDFAFDIKKGNISPLGETYSVYHNFWEMYIKRKDEFEIDVEEIFRLIDYIQKTDNRILKKMVESVYDEDVPTNTQKKIRDMLLLRKNNLYSTFENMYQKSFRKKREKLAIEFKSKKNVYSKKIVKKLESIIAKKKLQFIQQRMDKFKKQENINVISSGEAWYLADKLNYLSRNNFLPTGNAILKELINFEKKVSNICEKLAVNLYVERVKAILKEKNMINCGRGRIKRIMKHPNQLRDLFNIEYNFRFSFGNLLKSCQEYAEQLIKQPGDILIHLNYIQLPLDVVDDMDEKERKEILTEYEKKGKENLMYKVVYGILAEDFNCFESMDDSFPWKYIGKGLLYELDRDEYKSKKEFEKVLFLNNDREAIYCAHMLLGRFYEYYSGWFHLYKYFEAEKAITSYKKALKIKPDSIEAHLSLANLYLIKELPGEALQEFMKIEKLVPQYAKKHFCLKNIKEKGEYKRKKDYLEAVRMNTLSGREHYVLGLACLIKKDKELAHKHLDKALKFGYQTIKLKERKKCLE